jgi:hypothetical protein
MSVSDPAPLPRLGEVFFDVRGNSRSMRLSWYADTGVAVFSIWQAGMCTGTFRLPIADLSRMIEILERGPAPRGRGPGPVSAAPHGEDRGSDSEWYYGPGADEPPRPGTSSQAGYGAEGPADYGRSGYDPAYDRSEHGPVHYGAGEGQPADYGSGGYGQAGHRGAGDRRDANFDAPGYGTPGGYGSAAADYGATDERYPGAGYGAAGDATSGEDYRAEGYSADYGRGQYGQAGGYGQDYDPASYGSGGYGAADADYRTGEYSDYADERRAATDRGYLPGDYDDRQELRSGQGTEDSGYRDERFVAPYVGDGGQNYPLDNPPAGSGYQGDIGDAAYPADRRSVSSADRYREPSAPDEEYSYGAEYRHR